jgi:Tfp pilus assembly protein PilF
MSLGNLAQECYETAKKMDPKLAGALSNMGNLRFMQKEFENACFDYLYALEIDPSDSEILCNLGLALSKTQYKDYAVIAFEEAVNSAVGNTEVLMNYLLFLLETQQFDKFNKVLIHANRVMDETELKNIKQLSSEFQKAVNGTKAKDYDANAVEKYEAKHKQPDNKTSQKI